MWREGEHLCLFRWPRLILNRLHVQGARRLCGRSRHRHDVPPEMLCSKISRKPAWRITRTRKHAPHVRGCITPGENDLNAPVVKSNTHLASKVGVPRWKSGSCRCAIIGVPWYLRRISPFSTFDNMMKLTMSPQAKRAEADHHQGTPTVERTRDLGRERRGEAASLLSGETEGCE